MIDRPPEHVFDYVADARNNPRWCAKVVSSDLVSPGGPGAGARFAVVHKPIPGRPARRMEMECQRLQRPTQVHWHEDDGRDSVDVTYALEDLAGSTRFTQRSIATLAAPRVLAPIMRHGIGRDIDRQLKRLKQVLEQAR